MPFHSTSSLICHLSNLQPLGTFLCQITHSLTKENTPDKVVCLLSMHWVPKAELRSGRKSHINQAGIA